VNASQATNFSDLPAAVLSELARQCKYGWFNRRGGHPLLAVCRATRDGVLASLTRINLTVSAAGQPEARLLAKAASQAPPGLEIKLRLQDDHALLTLLQAGVYSKGWARVHSLLVRASTGSSTSAPLDKAAVCTTCWSVCLHPCRLSALVRSVGCIWSASPSLKSRACKFSSRSWATSKCPSARGLCSLGSKAAPTSAPCGLWAAICTVQLSSQQQLHCHGSLA
jgi:hypothetical protein